MKFFRSAWVGTMNSYLERTVMHEIMHLGMVCVTMLLETNKYEFLEFLLQLWETSQQVLLSEQN